MQGEKKNLKDPEGLQHDVGAYGAGANDMSVTGSCTKTHKLITALYMVTDIMDKEEPLRLKLRTLGVDILSDMPGAARMVLSTGKIDKILSLLDIAFTMNMISEMNKNILVNEFSQLKNSLVIPQNNPTWLEDFLASPSFPVRSSGGLAKETGNANLLPPEQLASSSLAGKGHTRLGVQKGSTLLKALKDIHAPSDVGHSTRDKFNILKKQRRDKIIHIIKTSGGNATIKDIRIQADVQGSALYQASGKTIQRELVSMVKDGVLYKEGEKRWSRYIVK